MFWKPKIKFSSFRKFHFQSQESYQEQVQEKISDLSRYNSLRIQNINGNISLKGDQNDQVVISITKQVKAKTQEEARKHIDDIEISIKKSSKGYVQIAASHPPGGKEYQYTVHFKISLPVHFSASIENSNGNIFAANLQSDLTLRNGNGENTLTNIRGSIDAENFNGNFQVNIDLPIDGHCRLRTMNGNIDLKTSAKTSAKIKAGIVNGYIDIKKDMQITKSGRTVLKGILKDGKGTITLETTNGFINIR